jgi:hypothetical protein
MTTFAGHEHRAHVRHKAYAPWFLKTVKYATPRRVLSLSLSLSLSRRRWQPEGGGGGGCVLLRRRPAHTPGWCSACSMAGYSPAAIAFEVRGCVCVRVYVCACVRV